MGIIVMQADVILFPFPHPNLNTGLRVKIPHCLTAH